MKAHLTDVSVRALKESSGQYKVWDKSTRGFGVLVGKSKSWIVMHGSDRRLKVVGKVADMGLAVARKEAKKYLANGIPVAVLPYSEAVELFLEDKGKGRRTRTVKDYRRLLARVSLSLDVSPHDLSRELAKIDAPSEYNHVLVAVRVFFNWCVKRRYVPFNPTASLSQHKSTRRSRVLTDDELKSIWEASGNAGQFGTIVRLLILTGMRRGEVAALQSSWIKENQITLPASVTKNAREHTIPLGHFASSILSENLYSDQRHSSDLLFPARGKANAPFNGWSKAKVQLDAASQTSNWTLHDLRRTFRTIHARIGTPPWIAERLLNHVSSRDPLEDTYNQHKYLSEMRLAQENYEVEILKILEPLNAA